MCSASVHSPLYVSENKHYREYGNNTVGRDFVIGDIHGEKDRLVKLLESTGFVFGVDRLFCTGDLVDRGPESIEVLRLLLNDGVIAVLGNHEQWCLQSGLIAEPTGHRSNGGAWFYELSDTEKQAVATFLFELPVALSFIGPCGKTFGMVHAECTYHRWDYFKEMLCGEMGESLMDHHVNEALWSRTRLKHRITLPVRGVEKVFVGHSVVSEVTTLGNVVYLDTGGCFSGGHLSLLELLPCGGQRIYQG